jgi:DNA-binding HxlR family transcriptional regulator
MLGKDYEGQDCALARALEVIGERWTLLIIRDAFYGVQRFSDFQAHLDIPRAILTQRLNGLVNAGILERSPDAAHAGRQLYRLTAPGRELWPALHSLLAWGSRHLGENSRVFRHTTCGGRLDDSGACRGCGVTPAPTDISNEPRPGRRRRRTDRVAVALNSPHRLLEPLPLD